MQRNNHKLHTSYQCKIKTAIPIVNAKILLRNSVALQVDPLHFSGMHYMVVKIILCVYGCRTLEPTGNSLSTRHLQPELLKNHTIVQRSSRQVECVQLLSRPFATGSTFKFAKSTKHSKKLNIPAKRTSVPATFGLSCLEPQ